MSAERNPRQAASSFIRRRKWWVALGVFLVLLAAFGFFVIRPFWRLASQFDDITYRQPSRA